MKFRQYGPGKACEHENGADGSRDLDGHVCEYSGLIHVEARKCDTQILLSRKQKCRSVECGVDI